MEIFRGHAGLIMDAVRKADVTGAAVLAGKDIAYDAAFRRFCEDNRCGNYGKYYSCPPAVGTAEAAIGRAHAYPFAVIYQNVYQIKDAGDMDGMLAWGQKHTEKSYEIQKLLLKTADFPFLHLSTGGCRLCEACALKEHAPCRHPEMVLPSLSGFCVNVAETCGRAGMEYRGGENRVCYFGLIYFE